MIKAVFVPDMVTLNETFFRDFRLPYLVNMQLAGAQISIITSKERNFSVLPNLVVLNMSHNYISLYDMKFMFLNNLQHLPKLKLLDISHQTSLLLYDTNGITFYLPPNLSELDMSNTIQRTEVDIEPFVLEFKNPSKLGYLKFQGNMVHHLSEFNMVSPDLNVRFVADLSQNNMISFAGSFNKTIMVHGLCVSGLLLYDNKLGDELGNSGEYVFKYLKNLVTLDLSSNGIKHLPYSTFKNQNNLRYLNLSKNSLPLMNFQISHMTNIQKIDISNNLLSQFNQQIRDDLDTLKHSSPNFTLNLLGNPIQCFCETLSFLKWMYHRQAMFVRFGDYSCIHDGEVISFKNMKPLLDKMDFTCSLNLIAKVSAGLLAFVICVTAISVFLYRHKWDVRFFCLKFIASRKSFQELLENETSYEYDAFVAYDNSDLDWVRNELYENLDKKDEEPGVDGQPRFRLCIHDRDFMPGTTIEENILKAIESSRKKIVVLSRNFLRSKWCDFELHMAWMESIEKGRNLINAVLLEPLSVDDMKMSGVVERLLRRNTYIEWPNDQAGRCRFWDRLRATMEI